VERDEHQLAHSTPWDAETRSADRDKDGRITYMSNLHDHVGTFNMNGAIISCTVLCNSISGRFLLAEIIIIVVFISSTVIISLVNFGLYYRKLNPHDVSK
jgi:predicted membrane protein